MYTQKLLLPWGKSTILGTVLENWTNSVVHRVTVVCGRDPALVKACREWDVDVVEVDDPPEMKDTILAGLRWVEATYSPSADDAWMLAPTDMPKIDPKLIAEVNVAGFRTPDTVTVPRVGRHRGHPVFFPWGFASQVAELGSDEGVNAIVQRSKPCLLDTSHQGALMDLDTPEQYARMRPAIRNR